MLQQTQVKTVIPYYHRFLKVFPDARALAAADEERLLKQWQGLGYYRRARNLQKAARQIVEHHDGRFPEKKEEIDALAGVGPYTGAAVASIAFGLPHACVDGNVIRVITRLDAMDGDVSTSAIKKQVQNRAEELLEPERAGDYNQAMMELGATICTPRKPSCLTCPVNAFCATYKQGDNPEMRPFKSKKVVASKVEFESLFLYSQTRILLARRPQEGLMAGMWELPSRPKDERQWQGFLAGNPVFLGRLPKPVTHRFTHLHATYHISVFKNEAETDWIKRPNGYAETRWVGQEDMADLPLTNVLFKVLPRLTKFMKEGLPCQPKASTLPGMQVTN